MKLFRHAAWSFHAGLLEPSFVPIAWRKLQLAMPDAIAVCFLPEEIHVVTAGHSASDVRRGTNNLLRRLDRAAPGVFSWESGPDVAEITSPAELLESVRQVLLGPVRYGLTDDPLSWMWSNYRDLVRATERPWPAAPDLEDALEGSEPWSERFVTFIDRELGTPRARRLWNEPIDEQVRLADVIAAAAAAHRASPRAILSRSPARSTFIGLASEAGFAQPLIAAVSGVSTATVRQSAHLVCPGPSMMCLSEAALRAPVQKAAEELVGELVVERRVAESETIRVRRLEQPCGSSAGSSR